MTSTVTSKPTTTELPSLLAGAWDIDPSHSEASFVVRHLMVSKVRGRFTDLSGSFVIADDLTSSHVEAEVALASIDTNHADRDAHLRSADFFDVDRYPTLQYHSTDVRVEDEGFVVDGELSLHGVTRPVVLTVEFLGYVPETPFGDARVGFSATAEIDRRDFGLEWNLPVEGGGVVLGHKVQITLDIEAIRRIDA